jgi:hypothetical protein
MLGKVRNVSLPGSRFIPRRAERVGEKREQPTRKRCAVTQIGMTEECIVSGGAERRWKGKIGGCQTTADESEPVNSVLCVPYWSPLLVPEVSSL